MAANLLKYSGERLNLLVRAADEEDARQRLWQSLQIHMDFEAFAEYVETRIEIFRGDLTSAKFGLDEKEYGQLAGTTDSVIHCAASLNRKSEKNCLNVNLRGTLHVIQLAGRAKKEHGLRRFSHVSTVAVAGQREHETVHEDSAIDWHRSDYDPYARTKKFSEYMVRELLPDVPLTIFRPSIVLGDSRRPETNQFEMVKAFVFLAGLPVLPFRPDDRIDIVPVDYVAEAISTLHQKQKTEHSTYHLSSGKASETFQQLTAALAKAQGKRGPIFAPRLEGTSRSLVKTLANRKGKIGGVATLLKVFLPYLVWDTVFDNTRVTAEMGRAPAPFSRYCAGLYEFSRKSKFHYPYIDWPLAPGQPLRKGAGGKDPGKPLEISRGESAG